jgi:hypothetical protein
MNDASVSVDTKDPIATLLKTYAINILVVVSGLLPLLFVPTNSAPFEYTKIFAMAIGTLVALVLFSLSGRRAPALYLPLG